MILDVVLKFGYFKSQVGKSTFCYFAWDKYPGSEQP